MRRWVAGALCILVIAALCVRLVPYKTSEYPYNVDGYPLVKGAERAMQEGSWDAATSNPGLENYNSKMPIFSYLLAEFCLLVGIEPMRGIQLLTPLLGTAAVLIGFALAKRLTGSDVAALGCAAFLALEGFFVYVTTAGWKEALGIPLLMMVFLLYAGREDWRKRMLLAGLLLLLPLVHHLTALIAFSFVLMACCATLVSRWREDRFTWSEGVQEVALGPGLAVFAYAYYTGIEMPFFTEMNNFNNAALLAAVILLGAVVAIMLAIPALSKPWFLFNTKPGEMSAVMVLDEKALALLIGYGVLLLNGYIQVFSGTMTTSKALLWGVAPLVPIFLFAVVGANVMRYSDSGGKLVMLTLGLPALFLLVFAVSRAYDPFSFSFAYRMIDYLDPFIAVAAGAGLAFAMAKVFKRWGKGSAKGIGAAVAIFVVFVALLASTAPLAYEGERLYGITSETKPQEFRALKWAACSGVGNMSSNYWNADIAGPYFGIDSDYTLPYRLREGKGYSDIVMVLDEEWMTDGAQMPFSERMVIEKGHFNAALESGDLVYCAGPPGEHIFIVVPD